MIRIALALVIAALSPLAAAQRADPTDCLLAYLHPLVEAEPNPIAENDEFDPLDDLAYDCRVKGYVGEVLATVHWYGVNWIHSSHVTFFLDPESEPGDETLFYLAVGIVDTWVNGTDTTNGCIYSSPVVRHVIPTDDEVDHPMTDGWLSLVFWSEPPSLVAGGAAFVDLPVTGRCPSPQGGYVTETGKIVPAWAWLSVQEPMPIGDDLSVISGTYTAPGGTSDSWSTWSYHFRQLESD